MKSLSTQAIQNDVLFQKLGNTWYIFSEIDNEVVYSAMPDGMDPRTTDLELYQVIEDHMQKVAQQQRGLEAV
jgi:hypothetical protein